jgi:hypothetical protein
MNRELLHYSDKGGHYERSTFHKTMKKLEIKGLQPTKGEVVLFTFPGENTKKKKRGLLTLDE